MGNATLPNSPWGVTGLDGFFHDFVCYMLIYNGLRRFMVA